MKFQLLNFLVLLTILLLLGGIAKFDWPFFYVVFPVFLWFIAVSLAASHIRWNFFLRAVSKGNSSGKKIALTFDDGPHPKYTPAVLELLEKYQAKASFFCIGKKVKHYPEILQKMHSLGHSIGNHSFSHSYFIDFNSTNRWKEEIEFTDLEIEKAIGQKPVFFRPPYGITTPELARAVRKTGHVVVGWNIRSFDTFKKPEQVIKKVLKQAKSGSIILLHDHRPEIVPILENLLPELLSRNFTFVTVEELIDYETHT